MAANATIAIRGRKVRKEPVAFSEPSIRHNSAIVEYCRTSMSALSGATAGITGLTGLYGFIFYFLTAFMLSFMLLLKAGSQWQKFFRGRGSLFTGGLMGGLFTYILFWTFLYGMVHVYWTAKISIGSIISMIYELKFGIKFMNVKIKKCETSWIDGQMICDG